MVKLIQILTDEDELIIGGNLISGCLFGYTTSRYVLLEKGIQ